MKYSFIIPVKEINDYIRESIPKILEIARDDYEIIIYPNEINSESWPKTRQIASGPGGPAMKRTLAIRDALGEILIFIDDDAYPEKDFLEKLDQDFTDDNIVAVGGPAITPEQDNLQQKISGAVFLSKISGGCPERYAPVGPKRFIDDWPSVNLSVRKKIFEQVGGFNSAYWPGEDTLFCLELLQKLNKKILYNPELKVWHHRRAGFLRHLKQVGSYGLHRGFFAKKFPKTSLRFKYFLPTLFLFFIIGGFIASYFSITFFFLYVMGWLCYCLALLLAIYDIYQFEKDLTIVIGTIPYIFGTHLVYGWQFMRGLFFTRELKSKLR